MGELTVPQERKTLLPLAAAASSNEKVMMQLGESLVQPCIENSQSKELSKISLADSLAVIHS